MVLISRDQSYQWEQDDYSYKWWVASGIQLAFKTQISMHNAYLVSENWKQSVWKGKKEAQIEDGSQMIFASLLNWDFWGGKKGEKAL